MEDQTAVKWAPPDDADDVIVDVAQAEGGVAGWPVSVGVPFPIGMLRDPAWIDLRQRDGAPVPVAARTLVAWPDGSARWCLVKFLARQTGTHRIKSSCTAPAQRFPELIPVQLNQHNGERWTVDNGIVRLALATSGPGPVESLSVNGRNLLAGATDMRFTVDDADTTRETRPRMIHVLERDPLQVRLRIDGECVDVFDRKKLKYRLSVELWAGWPCVRLDYQFFHVTPGVESLPLRRMAFELNLAIHDTVRVFQQKHYGLFYRSRIVRNPDSVALVADDTRGDAYVEDASMLMDETNYPSQLRPPLVDTHPWLGISDAHGFAALLGMEDLEEMRPKRLWSSGSKLGLDIWPELAGQLELPQGWSRRVSMTLGFTGEGQSADYARTVATLLRSPRSSGRATVDPAWLARCRESDQHRVLPFGRHARFEQYFRRLISPQMPQGMFDLGDTPDTHYQQTYIPLGEDFVRRRTNAPRLPKSFLTGNHILADWAQPQMYESVWTNNEYDLIHALAVEMMRTGRADLFTPLRRAVRHNIEVDFVHYSDYRWCHRASPVHCPGHTRNGAYPSHYWTQGLLEYYCLTGDDDALEVAMALGDKVIETFEDPGHRNALWGFNRELGWPLLSLSCLADLTGETRYFTMLEEIIGYLVSFDRDYCATAIYLSGVDGRHSFVRQMVDAFFGYASMIEGIDLYLNLRPRPDVEQWFIKLLRELRAATWQAQRDGQALEARNMLPQAMAIGYERTGESEFIDAGMAFLEQLLDSAAWLTPTPQTKPIAMIHRGLVRFLGHAYSNGRLGDLEYRTLGVIRPPG